eukprot:Lithocolla_globosa_v1_NODE_2776_length_1872_cov_5.470556.p1 type:complete len:476 gc:universal NODE_2776_length_1872_cov_5.470556:250-1677(+)
MRIQNVPKFKVKKSVVQGEHFFGKTVLVRTCKLVEMRRLLAWQLLSFFLLLAVLYLSFLAQVKSSSPIGVPKKMVEKKFSNPIQKDKEKDDMASEAQISERVRLMKEISSQNRELKEWEQAVDYIFDKYKRTASELKRVVVEAKGKEESINKAVKKRTTEGSFSVATYNLWNVNEPFLSRMNHIKKMLKTLDADVVALQEVRNYKGTNQLDILYEDLKGVYPYQVYQKVLDLDDNEEGLGILSRYPIVSSQKFVLQTDQTNQRVHQSNQQYSRGCLQVTIDLPSLGLVQVFNTHVTFIDTEQCRSATQLLSLLNAFKDNITQVLLGDFNVYFDFEYPIDYLTHSSPIFELLQLNPCSSFFKDFETNYLEQSSDERGSISHTENLYGPKGPLLDTWSKLNPNSPGHTFSNYRDHRLEDPTRADRILARPADIIQVESSQLFGNSPIPDEEPVMYPSDHRGVLTVLSWGKEKKKGVN